MDSREKMLSAIHRTINCLMFLYNERMSTHGKIAIEITLKELTELYESEKAQENETPNPTRKGRKRAKK